MDNIEAVLKKEGDGSLYFEARRTEVFQVAEFSNRKEYKLSRFKIIQNNESLKVFDYTCIIVVPPKGRRRSPEDPLFLQFELSHSDPLHCEIHESINCRAEWTCLVSIVDSEGCLRYPQSLTWVYDGVEKRRRHDGERVQVVSADTLRREADVLLPNDTLTIRLDVIVRQYYAGERCKHITYRELRQSSFETDKRLRLDSPVGELLRRESRYFECMCATSMAEKNSGCLEIPQQERATFMRMVKILSYPHFESHYLAVTLKDILDVYSMAHFYGIERALDTCRCWLRLICRDHSSLVTEEEVSEISEIAETYEDSILREIVEGETEMQSGSQHESWIFTRATEGEFDCLFVFKRRTENENKQHVTEDVSALSHCYI